MAYGAQCCDAVYEWQSVSVEEVLTVKQRTVLQATAYRKNISGIPNGFAMFWNLRKS